MDKIKILVIDDDRIILRTMSNILEEEGYTVETATSGEEGIKKARESMYDLIFMDLNMPDKHGLEVMKEIRAIDQESCISIITGYGTVDSAITAMKLNAADYILKPIDPDQILQSIKMVMKRKELEKEIMKRIPKPKVLLVSTNEDTLVKIKEKLLEENIQVLTSNSHYDTLSQVKKDMTINTIICDLGKKEIDGIELLRDLKGISPEISFIPLTAMPDIGESILLMKEGARDYLVKPVKSEDLLSTLKQAWQSQSQTYLNKQLIMYLQKINEEVDMAYKAYKKVTERSDRHPAS